MSIRFKNELELLEELYRLSELKTDSITKDNLDSLEKIVLKEEALSKKLKISDDACAAQVQFFLKGQNSVIGEPFSCRDYRLDR